jgi:threonine dehydrogenase-like Zn-dependent dehydrogenase
MKAVVYQDVEMVSVEEVPDAAVELPDDAVVRVTTAAICGSDLHFYHGKAPMEPGETLGHEAVGVVESTGPDVARFKPGDRVVVAFDIACGECWFCRKGQTQLCEDFRNLGAGVFGGELGGAQAEKVRVPHADTNLMAVPEGLDDERAIFVGDTLTTGYYGAASAGIQPGDVVAILGAGPVGFFTAQAARLHGAADVVVLDREPDRLDLARKTGATAIDVREHNPQMALADRTDGRGADVVIEAVGTAEAFEDAVDIVRRGGIVEVLGMFTGESVEIPLGVYWARTLDIRFAGICPVHAWWERSMQALVNGDMDPSALVSHRLPLEEAASGYKMFAARQATKVLLKP